jgi:putative hydrolase of the HAD superfamily
MAEVRLLLWDVGGVILSNGWDRDARRAAAERFGLDPDELDRRHDRVAEELETGRSGWDAYLAYTVFHTPRAFSPEAFRRFVWERSTVNGPAFAVARELREGGRYVMAALNNESRELNEFRIERFRLREVFHLFLSSCYTGRRKPDPEAFRYALSLTQSAPDESLLVDDRTENVEAAARLGLRTVRVRDPGRLREDLLRAGISTG